MFAIPTRTLEVFSEWGSISPGFSRGDRFSSHHSQFDSHLSFGLLDWIWWTSSMDFQAQNVSSQENKDGLVQPLHHCPPIGKSSSTECIHTHGHNCRKIMLFMAQSKVLNHHLHTCTHPKKKRKEKVFHRSTTSICFHKIGHFVSVKSRPYIWRNHITHQLI